MNTNNTQDSNIISSAAFYAVYLGMFWVFKYIFLITSQFAGDLYLYLYKIMAIGTPVLFYALASVYRDKRLGGNIDFGQVILFGIFLFFFASLLEAVIIALHIMVVDPHYLTNFQNQMYMVYEERGFPDKFLKIIKQGLNFGPMIFLVSKIIEDIIYGLVISFIFGYFICMKKNKQSSNN